MKQFAQSNSKTQAFAACAAFACVGLVQMALGVSLSVMFIFALILSIILLGLIRLVCSAKTIAY